MQGTLSVRNNFFSSKIVDFLVRCSFCVLVLFIQSCATTEKQIHPAAKDMQDMENQLKILQEEEFLYNETHFQDGSPIVTSKNLFANRDTILLTFAGDLMAHPALWQNGEFERIYEDVEKELQESDFSFTNLETPVVDSKKYSGYPGFNVHSEYVQCAVDAGFNVFSLTNNHTNDQGLVGINSTRDYFEQLHQKTKDSPRPIYHAGLKEKRQGPFTYQTFEKNGWKILFVAITEILNNTSNAPYIDYVPPYKIQRDSFVRDMEKLKDENPCDLFIISIHCWDTEYVFDMNKQQIDWYHRLLDGGADVVWVNHPHVAKDWELVVDEKNVPRKMIFYSMGNFVSKHEQRRNTGEGFMTQLVFEKSSEGITISQINPILLTTYKTKDNHYVVKKLNNEFLLQLEKDDPGQLRFYKERLNFMKKISGKVQWQ